MSQAYTPALTVSARTLVRKERRLPIDGEVLVQVGDRVEADSVVARTELPGAVRMIPFAPRLGVAPERVRENLCVELQTPVEEGQLLAERTHFFGWWHERVCAPVIGILESLADSTGQGVFREPPRPVEVRAYLAGQVVERHEDRGATVEAPVALVQGIFGLGGECQGHLQIRPDVDLLEPASLDAADAGAVLVIRGRPTAAALRSAAEMGVRGIVCGSIEGGDVKEILGRELGVAITGDEDLGLSLVVTEGFGVLSMSSRTLELLLSHHGEAVSLNGTTQIRAGVQRPEVVIPLGKSSEEQVGEFGANDLAESELRPGTRVRIVRRPHFGAFAIVSELPVAPERLPSEALVRVLRVVLQDGSTLTLPRANVERIEG